MSPQDHGGLRVEASTKNDQASKSGLISQAFKASTRSAFPPVPFASPKNPFPCPSISHSATMTPTPPSHSSLSDPFRFRTRRQRNANHYDPSRNVTPTQPHAHAQRRAQPPVTPLVHQAAGQELSDVEVEDEEDETVDADGEGEMDDEGNDAEEEEEEGGVEEGLL